MSLNEIRKAGLAALVKELGPVDMVRFFQIFDRGEGNYTKERKQWLDDITLEDIIEGMKKEREKNDTEY